jgi:hypothetical protein
MKTISLRKNLEALPGELAKRPLAESKARVILATTKTESMPVPTKCWDGAMRDQMTNVPVERPVITSIPAGDAYHNNLIGYLDCCWAAHYGIAITPDMIWFHAMNEIAGHIKGNAEQYRSLFTTAKAEDGKTEIVMQWDGSPSLLNLGLLVSALREFVPSDITPFIPSFTTTTADSRMAVDSAFCEAMTPYYSYSVQMCGIPSVILHGAEADWELLASSAEGVAKVVAGASKYLTNIAVIAREIAKQARDGLDRDFWMDLYRLKRCGSGSQVEVDGWVKRLYLSKTPSPAFVCNFPTHITKVPFKTLDGAGNKMADYSLSCGLLSSKVMEGHLVPSFGWVLNIETREFAEKCAKGADLRDAVLAMEYVARG